MLAAGRAAFTDCKNPGVSANIASSPDWAACRREPDLIHDQTPSVGPFYCARFADAGGGPWPGTFDRYTVCFSDS